MTTPEELVPCCPQLEPCETCDTLNISYRLPFRVFVEQEAVSAIVTLRFQFERCDGPLAMGPLVYSQTLLPKETVRLAVSDRNSRFSFDSSTDIAHYNRASSEESFYLSGFSQSVSDLDIVDTTRRESSYHESAVSGGGGAGIDLGIFEIGGSVKGSSFDAESTQEITRNLSQHARSAHHHVQAGTRAASSVSIGAVHRRQHSEGESESHFESSARTFSNPNQCRALTFLFHQVVKCQTVRFRLTAVDRNIVSTTAPTTPVPAKPRPITGVTVVPQSVPANSGDLLETERTARLAASERTAEQAADDPTADIHVDEHIRREALKLVDAELMQAGLLDESGNLSQAAQDMYGWDDVLTLPTPGVMVRTCLDECEACEPELKRRMELELERMELENLKLEREIELMGPPTES